jgi:TolB-like protein
MMPQTRQLAVIMFTDIVGYTALMGRDEQKAFEFLNKNRQIQKPIIEAHNGRWIKELGDGVMASFQTVSDAVNAAIKIQEACTAANDFQLRIGIHLGEVVFENNDVFGDGVNIAARIQAAANPGTIYISEMVNQIISNKRDIHTRFAGEEHLKNVKDPVRLHEVMLNQETSARVEIKTDEPVKGKSIAVLPFTNMSSDPDQEYFSDGITEEIITDLSHLHNLIVISRSSVMTFKNTHKKIKDIAAELKVHYVLEGSVRKSGNNLRITAQLIDAGNDAHLWAEKYNGTLDDVFDIQEKVSRSIVNSLKLKLTEGEDRKISQRPIENLQAYECYLRARQEIWRFTPDGFERALQLVKNALHIVGENEMLEATLGAVYWHYVYWGIKPGEEYLPKLQACIKKIFQLNPESSHGFFLQALTEQRNGNTQAAVIDLKKSLKIEPNNPEVLFWICLLYLFAGKTDAARPLSERLLQVDPLMPNHHLIPGSIDWFNGKLADAVYAFEKAFEMDPNNPHIQFWYAYILASNNRNEEALAILNLLPDEAPEVPLNQIYRFLKFYLKGEKENAIKCITPAVIETAKVDFNWSWIMLDFYSLVNEKQEAKLWLQNSIRAGVTNYPLIAFYDPFLKNIRDEEWFKNEMIDLKIKWDAFEE